MRIAAASIQYAVVADGDAALLHQQIGGRGGREHSSPSRAWKLSPMSTIPVRSCALGLDGRYLLNCPSVSTQPLNELPLESGRPPTVSVIVPAYNAAPYIGEALDSVFGQTYRDFEVIVVNDGSPDTAALETALRPYLDRISYLQQQNAGPAAARNRGILRARGQYVAFLDSDDCWLADYLASQMKLFDRSPPPDLVSSDTELFGDSPQAGKSFWELFPPKGSATLKDLLTRGCAIVTSCTVARRQVILDAGLFDEDFYRSEDLDLWLRLAHGGVRIVLHRRVLARRRVHGDALTASGLKIQRDEVRVLDKLERTLDLDPDARAALRQRRAHTEACADLEEGKRYLAAGEVERARELLQRAFAFFRTAKLRLVLIGLRMVPRLVPLGAAVWGRWLAGGSERD
jgi:hypothetical protein